MWLFLQSTLTLIFTAWSILLRVSQRTWSGAEIVYVLRVDVHLNASGGQVSHRHRQRQEAKEDHTCLPKLLPWPHPHPAQRKETRKRIQLQLFYVHLTVCLQHNRQEGIRNMHAWVIISSRAADLHVFLDKNSKALIAWHRPRALEGSFATTNEFLLQLHELRMKAFNQNVWVFFSCFSRLQFEASQLLNPQKSLAGLSLPHAKRTH